MNKYYYRQTDVKSSVF
uniref:Uncharacterized protein n=1 Tax=Arundo donax TaxID=35708 RepID=A0A0A9A2D7_ARUDO